MRIIITEDNELISLAQKRNCNIFKISEESPNLKQPINMSAGNKPINTDNVITKFLTTQLGIKQNLSGFRYLKLIIRHSIDCPGFEHENVTSTIYSYCSDQLSKTNCQIERAIRTAIHQSFSDFGDSLEYMQVFGRLKTPPTNSTFLSTAVWYVRENLI